MITITNYIDSKIKKQCILCFYLFIFVPLKKTIVILFLLVFVSSNTELHQLLKLPVLMNHYLDHLKINQDESFFNFISEHDSSQPDHSDQEHHNLPFKTTDCATVNSVLPYVNSHQITVNRPQSFFLKVTPIYQGIIYSSAYLSNIWQPPKFG